MLIDSSSIITDPSQTLGSKYEFCFSDDDDLFRLVKDMPKGHHLRSLFDNNKFCSFDMAALNERINFTNRVFFMLPAFVRSVLALYVQEKANQIYWLSEPIFFDSPQVYYYRQGLAKPLANTINAFAVTKLEMSLYNYMFDFGLTEISAKYVNIQIYTNLHEFIANFTVVHGVAIASLRLCFEFLLSCNLLVLFVFLARKSLRRFGKRLKKRTIAFR